MHDNDDIIELITMNLPTHQYSRFFSTTFSKNPKMDIFLCPKMKILK